jgi:lipopolysaccharide export system permease protein
LIIRRAFYREATIATAGIVLVLVVVLVLFGMTAALGRAVRGDYAQHIVFQLLGWQTLMRFDLLLPLGLYLGVLLTFSRWYRDSEMTVLLACGVSLPQLLRPVLALSAVVALITAGAAFYVTPYAEHAIDALRTESARRSDIAGITPGTFTESGAGRRVVYAEDAAPGGGLTQIFISNPAQTHPRIILARLGHSVVDKRGDRFIVLSDGWAYEGAPGDAEYRIVRFDTYMVRMETPTAIATRETAETIPPDVLWRANDIDARAEWQWRLSRPILLFVLAIFALVLAYTDARRGRLANLFLAILIYFIYSNLLGVALTLMKRGTVPAVVGLWWVHVLMAIIALLLLHRRSHNRPLLPRWRRSVA